MSIERTKQWVENRLSKIYRSVERDNETYFCNSEGLWFKIDAIGDWNCLIIDYLPEDGDQFYPEDYNDLEKMFDDMLQEIEGWDMIVINIGKYIIKFDSASDYNRNSTYDLPYDDVIIVENDEDFCRTKVAEIFDGNETRRIALVVPYYTPDDFAVKADNRVFLCLNDVLCYFNPENGKLTDEKRFYPRAPIFGAYAYEDDFILYGELDIYRINRNFEIKWYFSARDIFVKCGSNDPAFIMKEDRICLYDFEDNYYEIDYDGIIITEQLKKN